MDLKVSWQVIIENLRRFKIELIFSHPELVSTDGLDPDKIILDIL